MDATQRMLCFSNDKEKTNPFISMGIQIACILVISHIFHLMLKTLGQPGPIAQIFAGLVLGPTGMSNIQKIREFFFQSSAAQFYEIFGFFCRMLFMFLIGLEMDTSFIMRNMKVASFLAYGGAILGCFFGIGGAFFFKFQLHPENNTTLTTVLIVMLTIAYSASPVVIRVAGDLKFATSDIGRLAIASSLINEITCLGLFSMIIVSHKDGAFARCLLSLVIMGIVILVNKYVAKWCNKHNRNKKYLRNAEVLFILAVLIGSSMTIELLAGTSLVSCFIFGVMFPKEGKTARTMTQKLNYAVHNFILPIYFGYLGFQIDLTRLGKWTSVSVVLFVILVSIVSKIAGTLATALYLKIPIEEGIVLGFLLNLRGHADLLFVGPTANVIIEWTTSTEAYNLMLIAIVINTVVSGVVLAFIVRKEEKLSTHANTALEYVKAEDELRTLACVYSPRQVTAILALMSALSGSHKVPVVNYMMHLIELHQRKRTNVSYHELEDNELSDEEGYGGEDVLEILAAVDAFTAETKIQISISKAVSTLASLYEDVCNAAEDLRAAIIILPFHKHQRIDGKMESGREGVRTTNQKIIRHAPCSIGIIVERGLAGVPGFAQLFGSSTVQHVATLFFGGPDDHEAIAWSQRMASHARINLTIIRFLSTETWTTRKELVEERDDVQVFMSLSSIDRSNDADNDFLNSFYNQYVTSGQVGYVEKYVNDGAETVAALRDIGDMYSLFIVGKGGRGHSPLTTGMSDWEECPELGAVGDLLASSDFNVNGSVLVIQQHRHCKKEVIDG